MEKGFSIDYCLQRFKNHQAEIRDYLTTIKHTKNLDKIMPDKDFQKNSLEKIIIEAEKQKKDLKIRASSKEGQRTCLPSKRAVLRPAIIFIIFLVLATFSFAGTLFASQDSIPGQTLYPLKRSFEDFKLNIYPENMKDELHFKFLNNRIDEANILLESEDTDIEAWIENLISEIDKGYQMCKQYRCFISHNEDEILDSIDKVKNRHKDRHGKDSGMGMHNR